MGKLSALLSLSPAGSAKSLEALTALRRNMKTAEFNRATGEIRARAYAGAEPWWYSNAERELVGAGRERAFDVGRRTLEDPSIEGMYHRGVAAYPAGDPNTRRHELFHGLVSEARARRAAGDPQPVSPLVDLLSNADYPSGGLRHGAARLAEELAAWRVGDKRPLSWNKAAGIAMSYAPQYRREHGLWHAMPAYAVGMSPYAKPAFLGSALGAAAHAPLWLPSGDDEEIPQEPADYLIQRLGE